jgi:hypothetical protein
MIRHEFSFDLGNLVVLDGDSSYNFLPSISPPLSIFPFPPPFLGLVAAISNLTWIA